MSVQCVGECRYTQVRSTHPLINSSATLLHHVSLTCGRIQTYPCEICHPPINPSGTEPYYTMSAWHMVGCRHTQVRCIPLLTAPQCYRALLHDVTLRCGRMQAYPQVTSTPPLIEPSATEPYWHNVSLTCGRMEMYPGQMYTTPLIKPSATEFYYTM